jgi:hypothetical protein
MSNIPNVNFSAESDLGTCEDVDNHAVARDRNEAQNTNSETQ